MNIGVKAGLIVATVLATVIAGLVTVVSSWKPDGDQHQQSWGEGGVLQTITRKQTVPAMVYLQTWFAVELPLIVVLLLIAGLPGQDAG
jgi:hypothetical protein